MVIHASGRRPSAYSAAVLPMLNNCLAVPLLADWAGCLWANGRLRNPITLLDEGQGFAAWRVLPALEEWQAVGHSEVGGEANHLLMSRSDA